MKYLLILSGYEDQSAFWERIKINIPSITQHKLDIAFCEDLLKKDDSENDSGKINEWLKKVISVARQHKIDAGNEIIHVASAIDLKKLLVKAECTLFSHNILSALNSRGMLNNIDGSIISYDSNFETFKSCIIVFDKNVNSITNFESFFSHFAKSLGQTEVILLLEIGRTLNDAAKNKQAVSYLVNLFKSVGVITYPANELGDQVLHYITVKNNSVLISHKANQKFLLEPNLKESLQNYKIAYYLDEF